MKLVRTPDESEDDPTFQLLQRPRCSFSPPQATCWSRFEWGCLARWKVVPATWLWRQDTLPPYTWARLSLVCWTAQVNQAGLTYGWWLVTGTRTVWNIGCMQKNHNIYIYIYIYIYGVNSIPFLAWRAKHLFFWDGHFLKSNIQQNHIRKRQTSNTHWTNMKKKIQIQMAIVYNFKSLNKKTLWHRTELFRSIAFPKPFRSTVAFGLAITRCDSKRAVSHLFVCLFVCLFVSCVYARSGLWDSMSCYVMLCHVMSCFAVVSMRFIGIIHLESCWS